MRFVRPSLAQPPLAQQADLLAHLEGQFTVLERRDEIM